MNSSLCTVFPRLFTSKVNSKCDLHSRFLLFGATRQHLISGEKKLEKVSADKNTQIKYTLKSFSSQKEYSCKIWFRQC